MSDLKEDLKIFQAAIEEHRYDFTKLVYIIFPFGQPGHELEFKKPYDWQMEEWAKLSMHLMNPATRYDIYRLIISSGNGAAKTAFGAMTNIMLLYTQQFRARLTANTDPQMKSIIWPEYDVWFRHARFNDVLFEKFGTSIKAREGKLGETWRLDAVTWDVTSPASISGLHNKGHAVSYTFEEAPGIPATIWDYTRGAFADADTIRIFMAFGNSDDPNSKFEQNMTSPLWHARRIDTRELSHIDKGFVADILTECGGDEDHDEFRVRIRGLPRKSAKDSIIRRELVDAAIERRLKFEIESVKNLPVIIGCDPAWRGGDETTIWYKQGNYHCLLEKYKLEKESNDTHMLTYNKLCYWERELRADAIFIDQAEGTTVYTLATNAGKISWFLINFASSATDHPEFKHSQFGNIRAQMYYDARDALMKEAVIDSKEEKWLPEIISQLTWTKGTRHKVHNKKMAAPKAEIKDLYGKSPDVADGFVLLYAAPVLERLPENSEDIGGGLITGDTAWKMPAHPDPYEDVGDHGLYD